MNHQKTILIVDDDHDIVEFVRVILEDAGYNVATLVTGDTLVQWANAHPPNLILLDMLLSGSDGRSLTRELKGQESTRHIPIILFSAYPNVLYEAQEAGADDFLAKPFELDELLAKVAQFT